MSVVWPGISEDLNDLDVQNEFFAHMPGTSAGMAGTARDWPGATLFTLTLHMAGLAHHSLAVSEKPKLFQGGWLLLKQAFQEIQVEATKSLCHRVGSHVPSLLPHCILVRRHSQGQHRFKMSGAHKNVTTRRCGFIMGQGHFWKLITARKHQVQTRTEEFIFIFFQVKVSLLRK